MGQTRQEAEKAAKKAEREAYVNDNFWWEIMALWEVYDWNIWDEYKREYGERIDTGKNKLLQGGKIGAEFGINHLSLSAGLVLGGYNSDAEIDEGLPSAMSIGGWGFGFGGDFSLMGTWGSFFRVGIGPGVRMFNLVSNELELNISPITPYIQGEIIVMWRICCQVRLEFPIINGQVKPAFGLSIGISTKGITRMIVLD